jgi:hypothetical protein
VNIDESVTFFQEFLTAVYEQEVADLTEPDDRLRQRVARTESFLYASPGATIEAPPTRPPGRSAEELAEVAAKAETPERRPLFLVAEYDVPGRGACFAAYVGGGEELSALGYERQYWAQEIDGDPKIVARYGVDFYADGVGWENIEGTLLGNIGEPVAVRAFQEPRIPRYRDDYQRIVAAGA